MSQPPQPPPAVPPPLPREESRKKEDLGSLGAPQVIFDTVGGPNLRLKDNLIQLGCVAVAVVIGPLVALIFTRDPSIVLLGGGFAGLVGGLLISGTVLGLYRFIKGVKKK